MGKLPNLVLRSWTNRWCATHGVNQFPESTDSYDFQERGERWLRRIVRGQRSQTLALITTQLNGGASRTVSKRTKQSSLQRMGFGSRRPTRVPLLDARHRNKSCMPDWNCTRAQSWSGCLFFRDIVRDLY
ncbi:HTH_Tnp_Tc3_2 domain-containing protein [Trichonephila clavipes]|nr:HTH_Tnp_Tc3_2 domain-containing protein [Trichonephila clavipes]